MTARLAISEVLRSQSEVDAVAHVDVERGRVLASSGRASVSTEAIDAAAASAAQLCTVPSLDSPSGGEPTRAHVALVVSDDGVQVLAPSRHGERAVLALARPGANIALLLASVQRIANGAEES